MHGFIHDERCGDWKLHLETRRKMDRCGTGANAGNENIMRSWCDRERYQSLGVGHVRLR